MVSKYLYKIYLIFIAFYLILGNIPRFINVQGFRDNVLLSEVILYFLFLIVFFYFFLNGGKINLSYSIIIFVMIVILSMLIGVFYNGVDIKSMIYNIRLLLIFFSAYFAGYICYSIYKSDYKKVLNFILIIYLLCVSIGIIIYIVFPESEFLWIILKRYGIIFNGDPHIHRFVSSYFDPNYYSAISCLPIIISLHLYNVTKKKRYVVFLILLVVTIILSGSRSGIATLFLLILGIYEKPIIKSFTKLSVKKEIFKNICVLLIFFILTSPLYINNLLTTIKRIIKIQTDNSALHRLISFEYGLDIFLKHPFTGVGYNFLSLYMTDLKGLSSVDSSTLATLINFGLILSFMLLLLYVYTTITTYKKINDNKLKLKYIKDIYKKITLYVVICIVFTSQFNNLLYYQFWLFPIILIYSYILHFINGDSYEKNIN